MQDLLMLNEPITVKQGNRISGTIQMIRNPKWRRHMTITLDFNLIVEDKEDKVGNIAFILVISPIRHIK